MTRRKDKSPKEKMKETVDFGFENALRSGDQRSFVPDKADSRAAVADNREGHIRICEEFWVDFLTVANVLHSIDSEADFYDVFNFIRINFNSGQPFSQSILNRVDPAIAKEYGPWTTT